MNSVDSHEVWYVKIRGRQYGPFDHLKLRSMAVRGQLSRIHQISRDGVTWEPATVISGLFDQNASPEPTTAKVRGAAGDGAQDEYKIAPNQDAPAVDKSWYYGSSGQPSGPVPKRDIERMIGNGDLNVNDLVWREGMADWCRIADVSELRHITETDRESPSSVRRSKGTPTSRRNADSTTLDPSLIQASVAARPWIMFVAVMGYVLGISTFLGTFYQFFVAVRVGSTVLVAVQLAGMLIAVAIIFWSWTLHRFCWMLVKLKYEQSIQVFSQAFGLMKLFWVYSSICIITWLIVIMILGILLITGVPIGINDLWTTLEPSSSDLWRPFHV